jgi:hypothetical protein
MIYRRIAIALVGVVLSFILGFLTDYQIERHTRNGRLARQVLLLGIETKMTDAQIAHAIGDDPMRVLRRSIRIGYVVELTVALIVGILVACFERQTPGRMTALTLAPYISWCYYGHLPFATGRPLAVAVTRELGISVVYLGLAILVSVGVARLFSRRARLTAIR